MPSSRIPSPARSQGTKSTPRRYKPRASRSVGSPAHSSSSLKLTNVIQMNSFALSPIPARKSVLTDTTDIDIPRRKSWWKKLDENSREIMAVLNNKEPAEANNAIEEYIEVDVLSQEKKNYTLDIPESSDGESINSIVIPQRKLFTQKESKPQKKFAQIIDNRESLATLHKTQGDDDKTLNVGRKKLFNQNKKQKTKPLFPSALINISANKTLTNKTKELTTTVDKGQVKNLFGNRPGTKRKNMFADFIVSDSEDEIPEIQPKVFEFHKKTEQKRRESLNSHRGHEPRLNSPTSSITDVEMEDWRLLPSSTLVDQQLEDGLRTTPRKRARLAKLSEAIESNNTESNTTTNKTKLSNKSLNSKRKSKNLSQLKENQDNELISPSLHVLDIDKYKEKNRLSTKNMTFEQNMKDQQTLSKEYKKNKNASLNKTNKEVVCDEQAETSQIHSCHNLKTLSKIDQMLQSDEDDEDFSLVYENDDNDEVQTNGAKVTPGSNAEIPKMSVMLTQTQTSVSEQLSLTKEVQSKSKSQNIIHQVSQKGNKETDILTAEKLHDKKQKKVENNVVELEKEILMDQIVDNDKNRTNSNTSEEEIHGIPGYPKTHEHLAKQIRHSHSPEISNETSHNGSNDLNGQNQLDFEDNQKSVNEEVDSDEQIGEVDHNESGVEEQEEQIINENYQNVNQEEGNNSKDIGQDVPEEYNDNNEERNTDNQIIINQLADEYHNFEDQASRTDEKTQNEKRNVEVEQNLKDRVDTTNIMYENKDNTENKNQLDEVARINDTSHYVVDEIIHNITGKHRLKNDSKVPSPEAILYKKSTQMESFTTTQKGNISVRKTKSIIKNHTIRTSLASIRESTGLSNESRNSSAEASGWDSHRTTRATLRQTFGKDFTPRKSLRALVMEQSAKRRTNFTETNVEISRFPQANSTELLESETFPDTSEVQKINQSKQEVLRHKSSHAHKVKESNNCQIIDRNYVQESNKSGQKKMHNMNNSQIINESGNAHEINAYDQETYNDIHNSDDTQKNYELDQPDFCHPHDDGESNLEVSCHTNESNNENIRDINEAEKINNAHNALEIVDGDINIEKKRNNMDEYNNLQEIDEPEIAHDLNVSNDAQEFNTHNHKCSPKIDNSSKINESSNLQEMGESDIIQERDDFDDAQEMDESYDAQGMEESDNEQEIDESDNAKEMVDSYNEQDIDESDNAKEMDESDNEQDMNQSDKAKEIDEFHNDQEVDESVNDQEVDESDNDQEVDESDNDQEVDESDNDQEVDESDNDQEVDESDNDQEVNESDNDQEVDDSDNDQEVDVSHNDQEVDESYNDQEVDESHNDKEVDESHNDQEVDESHNDKEVDESGGAQEINDSEDVQEIESICEKSLGACKTTLEIYLQKVKKQNMERKMRLENEIRDSLKAPTRDMLNPFKIPAIPKLRRIKTQQMKLKAKPLKSSVIPMNMLPVEVIEDMKYKPPKRYRPTNASWITKRLYKFLETKLEPKYDYKARIRSEKLVETIYNFTKDIRRHNIAPTEAVNTLKHEMARLEVVKTHFEFYEFFHEYMPREVRVKVVPDVFNKISLPKHGVFSEIIRQ